ncbi:hypothetical protein LY76DRAFT_228300 [Colletotrichum caudatum]|nr:hypothetical protein LY76DRAFT_228300 [Colletotrichum caudatum]
MATQRTAPVTYAVTYLRFRPHRLRHATCHGVGVVRLRIRHKRKQSCPCLVPFSWPDLSSHQTLCQTQPSGAALTRGSRHVSRHLVFRNLARSMPRHFSFRRRHSPVVNVRCQSASTVRLVGGEVSLSGFGIRVDSLAAVLQTRPGSGQSACGHGRLSHDVAAPGKQTRRRRRDCLRRSLATAFLSFFPSPQKPSIAAVGSAIKIRAHDFSLVHHVTNSYGLYTEPGSGPIHCDDS